MFFIGTATDRTAKWSSFVAPSTAVDASRWLTIICVTASSSPLMSSVMSAYVTPS